MNHKLHSNKMQLKPLVVVLCIFFICVASLSSAIAGCTLTVKITSHSNVKCHGDTTGSATATPSGGVKPYTYSWSPLGGTKATAHGLIAGLYVVTVTDSNGCTAKDSVQINQSAAINLTIDSLSATCGKNNGIAIANVTGGVAPYAYNWTPTGGTKDSAKNLSPGIYTCTVTDSNGCKTFNSTVITGTGGPGLQFGTGSDDGSCNGTDTAKVTGGTAPYSYSWSPGGATTKVITGLCAGTYCCVVTDFAGCKDTSCSTVSTITGVNTPAHSTGISIYPVPATSMLFITSNSDKLVGSVLIVCDVTGREVIKQRINDDISTYSLDISVLNEGFYILKIEQDSKLKINRFTVVR